MSDRYPQLDGWSGISILLVLAAHLLPLGPKRFQLNATAGVAGMAIFFTLSGFLITSFLMKSPTVANFISRRFFRIVPLALLYILVALVIAKAPMAAYVPHMLFYGNLPPFPLIDITAHLWSVCVEMQFYLGNTLERYAKRPLLFLVLFVLAHLSTFYYERRWIEIGRKLGRAAGAPQRGS
jgi:peptidoglycan/LPS O-acetylase OafA/YrhL